MLSKYKKSCQKIAMGLLSLIPAERDLKILQQTISMYQENPDWQLYFWKEGESFIGALGIQIAEDHFTIHHLSVLPSYQGDEIRQAMVEKIGQLMQGREMRIAEDASALLNKGSEEEAVLI